MLPVATYKEGPITLLYIPYGVELTDHERTYVNHILFMKGIPLPNWDAYNEILEGYILEDGTEEKERIEDVMNDDDHVDSFFEMKEVDVMATDDLRRLCQNDEIMLCTGIAGFCELNGP